MKKTFLASVLSLLIFFSFGTALALAQGGNAPGGGNPPSGGNLPGGGNLTDDNLTLKNPFRGGPNSLFGLLEMIINKILMPIGGVLAVLAFIYAGFKYVVARGNQSKIEEAHKTLLYVAIGTAILLGAWVFANTICQTIHLLGGPVCPSL